MEYKIGGEVYCIKTHSDGVYQKGEKYVVYDMKEGCKHYPLMLQLKEITHTGTMINSTACPDCKITFQGPFWDARSFVPIDNETSDTFISETITETIENT